MNYTGLIYTILEGEADELGSGLDALYHNNTLYDTIRDKILAAASIFRLPEIDEKTLREYFETASRQHRSVRPIDVDPAERMAKLGYKTWLTPERKKSIKWNYSEERYFPYLEDKGRSKKVIDEIAESSMYVLENMGDPKSDSFFKKGLVVGDVQSGKTAHFNAVINRSIDAGYRLIIILSGIMDDLRIQTQKRTEEDIIGYGVVDEALGREDKKGVGLKVKFGTSEGGGYGVEQIQHRTSHKNDYRGTLASAGFPLDHLNILVCKKNVGILKNLLRSFHDKLNENKSILEVPLLIIDDEADNASLNNMGSKGKEYASKVNSYIRAILGLFERKTYLGYTATPFANVLQDQNEAPDQKLCIKYKAPGGDVVEKKFSQVSNLFPEDFIEHIKSPSNYIGAKHLFETSQPLNNKRQKKIPLIEIVNDHIDEFPTSVIDMGDGQFIGIENHRLKKEEFYESNISDSFDDYSEFKALKPRASRRSDDFPKKLPTSLKDAIACFILAVAIRDSRKSRIINTPLYNKHNTMLVHISRFITWQNKTKDLIEKEINHLSSRLLSESPKSEDSVYKYFERLWFKYYAVIIENIGEYLPHEHKDEFIAPLSFPSILSLLPSAIDGVQVKALNSDTGHKLIYESPQKIIVVGGNRLSRGFTLEGLTINYFTRKTNYSDSLLQMGRWFGYRPGYLDCCKIFTTVDSVKAFDLTTLTVESLEQEFQRMKDMPGKSPTNFILRVMYHAGALQVTRQSILKNATKEKGSYQDHLVQTVKFNTTLEGINSAWDHFSHKVVEPLNFSYEKKKGFFISEKIKGCKVRQILQGIDSFISPSHRDGLIDYIRLCEKHGKLNNWTVAIKATGKGKPITITSLSTTQKIESAERNGPVKDSANWHDFLDKNIFYPSKSNIVTTGRDLSVTIPRSSEIKSAEKKFIAKKTQLFLAKNRDWTTDQAEKKAKSITIPEWVYRECIPDTDGLLIIYLIDINTVFRLDDKNDTSLADVAHSESINCKTHPLVGYAVGIPPIDPDPGGEFLKGNYNITEDIEDEEELELSDDERGLPDDYSDDEL
tara:strand:+ start:2025 stop:5195 length:3171 start_codon:yes stop_codon:yes gene_type:complete